MNILYLKGYKWLLPQSQRVKMTFLVIDVLVKYIKPFLKSIKVKRRQCPDYKECS